MDKIIVLYLAGSMYGCLGGYTIPISLDQAALIGNKIWHNECGGSHQALTFWKKGEDFASCGIGHFIWFPSAYKGPFRQQFPDLISFLRNHGCRIPTWLERAHACPWNSRDEFYNDFTSNRMQELRTLLRSTFGLQTQFIIKQLESGLTTMLNTAPAVKKKQLQKQISRLTATPMGIYALIDYAHFKGMGTNSQEQYKGQGWGLLHVLQRMRGTAPGAPAIHEFATIAKDLLHKRVCNAPQERNEQQWLKGWHNRINNYIV